MKHRSALLLLTLLLALSFPSQSRAAVEWTAEKIWNLEKPPLDMAFSKNGRWVFILTEEGTVLIYSADGSLNDTISVGKQVDGLQTGPREDILFLTSRRDKTIKEISLVFVYDIDVSGSPFKGRSDAPVVVAVFNDYQ